MIGYTPTILGKRDLLSDFRKKMWLFQMIGEKRLQNIPLPFIFTNIVTPLKFKIRDFFIYFWQNGVVRIKFEISGVRTSLISINGLKF